MKAEQASGIIWNIITLGLRCEVHSPVRRNPGEAGDYPQEGQRMGRLSLVYRRKTLANHHLMSFERRTISEKDLTDLHLEKPQTPPLRGDECYHILRTALLQKLYKAA